ncbi:MAG: hypothetical protein ACE148_13505 [Vicinamibacterales bacterium]
MNDSNSHGGHQRDGRQVANPEAMHEKRDIRVKAIAWFAAALLVAVVVIQIGIWLLFVGFGRMNAGAAREYPLLSEERPQSPPAPRLQEKPREDLKALRRHEENVLTTYGWLDKATGNVRIPIDEAMKRVLLMELPAREGDPAAAVPTLPPSDSSSGRIVEVGRQ